MSKENYQPVRWMACVYAKAIIEHASRILLEEAHPNPNLKRAEEFADEIETSLKKLRFNLGEPLSRPTENHAR